MPYTSTVLLLCHLLNVSVHIIPKNLRNVLRYCLIHLISFALFATEKILNPEPYVTTPPIQLLCMLRSQINFLNRIYCFLLVWTVPKTHSWKTIDFTITKHRQTVWFQKQKNKFSRSDGSFGNSGELVSLMEILSDDKTQYIGINTGADIISATFR